MTNAEELQRELKELLRKAKLFDEIKYKVDTFNLDSNKKEFVKFITDLQILVHG